MRVLSASRNSNLSDFSHNVVGECSLFLRTDPADAPGIGWICGGLVPGVFIKQQWGSLFGVPIWRLSLQIFQVLVLSVRFLSKGSPQAGSSFVEVSVLWEGSLLCEIKPLDAPT